MSDTYLTRSDLERWILDFASRSMDEHFVLSELDAASGDADHGSNMERGMSALLKSVRDWDKATAPREFFKDVGLHIVSSVGGGCPYVLSQGAGTSFFKNIWWARNGRDDRPGNRLPD